MVSSRPITAFLLIASFGILFAGCSSGEAEVRADVTFTAEDIARSKELAGALDAEVEDAEVSLLDGEEIVDTTETPVLDLGKVSTYNAIRKGPAAVGDNVYRVTNEYLNVRSEPRVTSEGIDRLTMGDTLELIEFVNAAWAKVRLTNGREGYVSERYIARLASESRLSEEKEKYKGLYFVDFGFLNVRKEPDAHSAKIGEFPGQSFVRPLSKDDVWARVPFEGGEGYVAVQYLTQFTPNFIVRQEQFTLPIFLFDAAKEGALDSMPRQIDALRTAGHRFTTLQQFRDLLMEQEERDVRLEPKSVVVAVRGITPENYNEVKDVLHASHARVTIFLETKHLGIDGITEKNILTLLANGHDIQSAVHSSDDLRSLTNAQVELELKQSRKLLEQYTGKQIFAVGYPMGGVNPRIEEKASDAGYLLGLSSNQATQFNRDELLRLPTLTPSPDATSEEVSGLLQVE